MRRGDVDEGIRDADALVVCRSCGHPCSKAEVAGSCAREALAFASIDRACPPGACVAAAILLGCRDNAESPPECRRAGDPSCWGESHAEEWEAQLFQR